MAPRPKKRLPPALRNVYVINFKGNDFLELAVIRAEVISRSDKKRAIAAYLGCISRSELPIGFAFLNSFWREERTRSMLV